MASSNLTDVLQLLNAVNPVMGDISKAGENIRKSFENNYLNRILDAAKNEREHIKKHPSRDIIMLRAIKNYTTGQNAKAIDSIIDTINTINTITAIQRCVISQEKPLIKSASKDGENTQSQMFMELTGMIMALSLLNGK